MYENFYVNFNVSFNDFLKQSSCAFGWINKRHDNFKIHGKTMKIKDRRFTEELTEPASDFQCLPKFTGRAFRNRLMKQLVMFVFILLQVIPLKVIGLQGRIPNTSAGNWFQNRTIQHWNQLPAQVLGILPCKPITFKKRVRKVIIELK
jgi:hypothetical protein